MFKSKLQFATYIIFTLSSFGIVCAATVKNRKLGPKPVFINKSLDFGTIVQGTQQELQFRFTNKGDETLRFLGYQTSCGCTVLDLDTTRRYQPSEEGVIKIIFDSKNFAGPVLKSVTLITNNLNLSEVLLTLRGVVSSDFKIEPQILDFDHVKSGTAKELVLSIVPGPQSKSKMNQWKVLEIDYHPELAELSEMQASSQSLQWKVKLKPQSKNFVKDQIRLSLKDSVTGKKSDIMIPLIATIDSSVKVDPIYIDFGVIHKGEEAKRGFRIRTNDKNFEQKGADDFQLSLVIANEEVNAKDYLVLERLNQN